MASTSTSKNKVPLVASIITLILYGNQLYVPEPPLEKEKHEIWKSYELIPFTISDAPHIFLVSFPNLDMNL